MYLNTRIRNTFKYNISVRGDNSLLQTFRTFNAFYSSPTDCKDVICSTEFKQHLLSTGHNLQSDKIFRRVN